MKAFKIIPLLIAIVAVGIISYFAAPIIMNGKKANEISNADQASMAVHAAAAGTKSSLTTYDSTGMVGIYTTLLLEKSNSHQLVFEVVMNTDSDDLFQYDLTKIAAISFGTETDNPGTFEWESSNKNDHHMIGYLKWNGTLDRNYKNIILDLKGIDNVSLRTFTWKKSKLTDRILTK